MCNHDGKTLASESRPTMRPVAPRLEMRRPLMDEYPRAAAVVLGVLAGLLGLLGGF